MSSFNPYPKKFRPVKEKKRLRQISEKRAAKIKEEKEYYSVVIADKRDKKSGKWFCEECENEIKMPTGRNVSHIISKGANPNLYLDERNNCLLCAECHWGYEFGDRTTMKIYERTEKIRETLTKEYYA